MRSVLLPHFPPRAPAPRAETCQASEDGRDRAQALPACPGPPTPLTVPPGSLSGRGAPTAPLERGRPLGFHTRSWSNEQP